MVAEHWRWLQDLTRFVLSKHAQKYLKNGNIYTFGRGKQGEPILIISLDGVKVNETEKGYFVDALSFTLLMIQKYMLVPGALEKIIVIVDLAQISAFQINKNLITSVFDYLGAHFPNLAERIFVFNMSQSINFLWSALQVFLPKNSSDYIKFVDQSQPKCVLDLVESTNLLNKYAGEVKEFSQNWPPKVPNKIDVPLSEQELGFNGYQVFTFTENFDVEIFPYEHKRHPSEGHRESQVMARISTGLGAYYPGTHSNTDGLAAPDSARGSHTPGFQQGQRNSFFPGRNTAYELKK